MSLKHYTLLLTILLSSTGTVNARDCKNDSTYLAMRETMSNAFNMGDSAKFFTAVTRLED